LLDKTIIIEFVYQDYQIQYHVEIFAKNFAVPIVLYMPLNLLVH